MPAQIFVLLFTFFAISCQQQTRISIAGSSTVLPIISMAAENYTDKTGVRLLVNAGGSGLGINQLLENKIDIAMTSRDLTSDELLQAKGKDLTITTIGIDIVRPVVSKQLYQAGIHSLTTIEIKNIYLGLLTNWKQLGGPDSAILVIDKESSRGTRHAFMQMIFENPSPITPGTDLVLGSNNEEQTAIMQSTIAIGMLSQAWTNDLVRAIKLKKNGAEVDIARNLDLIIKEPQSQEIKAFIDFLLSDVGQAFVKKAGYSTIYEYD